MPADDKTAFVIPLAPELEEMPCVIVGRFTHDREHFMEACGLGVDLAPNQAERLHEQFPFNKCLEKVRTRLWKACTFNGAVTGSLATQDFHLCSALSNARAAFESKVRR
jgi:hypothetical protein